MKRRSVYRCDAPLSIKLTEEKSSKLGRNTIPADCGKCYNCKNKRVAQWSFRLLKEMEVSTSAYFVTLTYDTLHVPIVNGRYPMTLCKNSDQNERLQAKDDETADRSLQAFIKRLRYHEEKFKVQYEPKVRKMVEHKHIRFYACGEYGTRRNRPHYHIILFNVADINSIYKAWSTAKMAKNNMEVEEWIPFGEVHIDMEVNANNIAYTLKYICKENSKVGKSKNDNRVPEFSLMSKGLGKNWITPEIETFYNRRLDIPYVVTEGGYKIPFPKYYANKMMTEETKEERAKVIAAMVEEQFRNQKQDDKWEQAMKFGRQARKKNYSQRNID